MATTLGRFDGAPVRSVASETGAAAVAGRDADVLREGPLTVAVWGNPRFKQVVIAELASRHGAASAVAEAYARHESGLLKDVSGSFAIALHDARSGDALLAVDRIGSRPLFHATHGDILLYSTTLDAIVAYPDFDAAIEHQAIYDYVYFHMIPGPRSIYAGCRRLLPGHYARWRNGRGEIAPYWEMHYVENERGTFPQLKEHFLAVLKESVQEAIGSRPTGTFLSGGTDSSTLAGIVREVTGEPARTYSIGFEASGYDEMEYARIAARHFGTDHHEYYVTPNDVVAAIPRIAAVHDQPFGNSSAVPTYYCAKLAREDGIEVLLGGDGGDELYGGNERYAKQVLYSLYSDLPRPLRKAMIEPVAFVFPEIGILGKAQRYIRNASLPMPARYDHYNLLQRLGPATVFTPEFLETVDTAAPQAQMDAAYADAHAQSLINRMLALDLRYTLADNDLPKVRRSCELAGVDVSFPLLNDAVVAFSARLAPDMKLKGTRLRYFFKEALRGFLPDEIITKTKHGFGLPFGPWLTVHEPLKQMALETLSALKRRRIVQPALLDELTAVHLKKHSDYYGTMVWILMMLEQWLAQHKAAV